MTTQTESPTRLHRRWLVIVRIAWAIGFITLTAMYIFGFLAVRDALSTVCEEEQCLLSQQIRHTDTGESIKGWPGPPIGYADRLRPDQVKALERLGLTLDQYGWLGALQLGIPALILLLIAAGLFWRKSNDWMVLFASIMVATFALHNSPLPFTLMVHQPTWEWVYDIASIVALSCLWIFPLVFPNGKFVPRWTRGMAIYEVAGAVIAAFFGDTIREVRGVTLFFGVVFLLPSLCAGVYAQLYRYFRVARPAERQQFKWVVFGLVGFVVTQLAVLIPLDALLASVAVNAGPERALVLSAIPDILWQLNNLLIAVCITISVLHYRLWDIDILINRALVYGALTVGVVGLYVLTVGWLSMFLQTQNDLLANVFAIMVIAFLFQPLRKLLHGFADRFVPVPQPPSLLEQHEHQMTTPKGQGASDTRLRGRWLLLARLAWVAVVMMATILYTAAAPVAFHVLATPCNLEPCISPFQPVTEAASVPHEQASLKFGAWYHTILEAAIRLLTLGVALLLFWRRSDDWMALLASIMLLATFVILSPSPLMLEDAQPLWHWPIVLLRAIALASTVGLFYLFPDGRFVPPWTRRLAIALLVIIGVLVAAGAPFQAGFPFFVVALATGAGVQIYRYRQVSKSLQRQQTKWVVFGIAGMVVPMLVFFLFSYLNPSLNPLQNNQPIMSPGTIIFTMMVTFCVVIPFCFLPVTLAFSLLRYRLWDVDILINRTLVYGALTGIIVIAFVVTVGLVSALFQASGNSIIAMIATGLVALLFNPLRQRLQRGVNHLMYGERDDPYAALSRLGRQLEASLAPEAVLPTVVTAVRDVLRLPYVAIYLQQDPQGYKIVAESASPLLHIENGRIRVPGMEREGRCIPLIRQGETLGYIVLGPRAPNEAFSSTDLRLLGDLAPQVGSAVHAVRLAADLQRSREQLVLAREEERRRLRRDLHDDLAPTLASLGLTASTVADLIPTDPGMAGKLVKELQTEIRSTVGNIRRLVYDLRPPTLDELGLLAAVRERATQYLNAPDGFHVTVNAPAELPALPAAVEVAVYRIVQEALENVSKHSQAKQCVIQFMIHDGLEIEIIDDGIGLPARVTPGVGLRSMRERAEELGGSCVIERCMNGGTRILAWLPIGAYDGTFAHPDRG